jgi:hypothetical protein
VNAGDAQAVPHRDLLILDEVAPDIGTVGVHLEYSYGISTLDPGRHVDMPVVQPFPEGLHHGTYAVTIVLDMFGETGTVRTGDNYYYGGFIVV